MFGLSRLVALILAFTLGFSCAAGIMVGGAVAVAASFKVRDLERHGIAQIPDELFMGDDPVVDLLDLNLFDFIEEMKTITSEGDNVTIDYIVDRYDLKLNSKIQNLLSKEARQIPIKQLFSEKGIHKLLSTVYIGYIEKYECHAIDSNESADPAGGKDTTRWYDPASGEYITGINATIAYFNLEDFASGNIHVDSVLHGIKLADVLGYTSDVDEYGHTIWRDSNGEKVTGIMSVFAGCTIDGVTDKINETKIGELIGYEEHEPGIWYDKNEETGETEKVHGFMNAVANSDINSLGNIFESLTIADLVPEEERTGIFAILPPETKLNEISTQINDSISGSPLQFFMNQNLMSFEEEQQNSLDTLCENDTNRMIKIAPDSEDYTKYYDIEGANWKVDADGNYLIPEWRTKPLNESFSYIVDLLLSVPSLPNIPDLTDETNS